MRSISIGYGFNVLKFSQTRHLHKTASFLSRFNRKQDNMGTSQTSDSNNSSDPFDIGDWGFKKDFEPVMKITQRFERDPAKWPNNEQAFGVTEQTFVGNTMHQVELRPERAFANFVPIGFRALKHIYKGFRAKVYYVGYKDTGIYDAETIVAGTRKAFEVISQAAHKNSLHSLVDMNICTQEIVDRFTKAGSHMSPRQRELLNVTESDLFGIAPGVLGPFQNIQQRTRDQAMWVTYSVLACAYYKKQLLYDAVKNVPLLEGEAAHNAQQLSMPSGYGYSSPRIVFGYLTFANKIIGNKKLDAEVKLFDFQYLVF